MKCLVGLFIGGDEQVQETHSSEGGPDKHTSSALRRCCSIGSTVLQTVVVVQCACVHHPNHMEKPGSTFCNKVKHAFPEFSEGDG